MGVGGEGLHFGSAAGSWRCSDRFCAKVSRCILAARRKVGYRSCPDSGLPGFRCCCILHPRFPAPLQREARAARRGFVQQIFSLDRLSNT